MKRQLVERLIMEGKSLKVALEAVGMAKSSYYYRPIGRRKPRALDEALVRAINEVLKGHAGVYGYRKVTMTLRSLSQHSKRKVFKLKQIRYNRR